MQTPNNKSLRDAEGQVKIVRFHRGMGFQPMGCGTPRRSPDFGELSRVVLRPIKQEPGDLPF
jgi:hypothetical protein